MTVLTEFILYGWSIIVGSLLCFIISWMKFPVLTPVSLGLFIQAVVWFVVGPHHVYVPILIGLSLCSLCIAIITYFICSRPCSRFVSILSAYFVAISAANILLQYQFGAAAFTYTTSAMTFCVLGILLIQLYSIFNR